MSSFPFPLCLRHFPSFKEKKDKSNRKSFATAKAVLGDCILSIIQFSVGRRAMEKQTNTTESDGAPHPLPTLEQFQRSGDEYELTYEQYKAIANEYRRRIGLKEINQAKEIEKEKNS